MFNKEDFIGRKFVCNDSGKVLELTAENVRPRAFIGVGNGAIDLGDGYYMRYIGNVKEMK